MHVLITGGTGFIGGALRARLSACSHAVTVLTRDVARARAGADPHIRFVDHLDHVEGTVDAIVNLAGANLAAQRWSEARKNTLVASRVEGTRALIDWMERRTARPRVLVSGSAIGWYGTDRGDAALTENSSAGADFPAQLCRRWEQEASRAVALGVRVCIVRTGVVLGAHGGALAKMLPPFKLGLGGPIASGLQWMSWISLDDIVGLLLWLLASDAAQGVYNGTAPSPVRNADFARTLADALHRPAFLRMPAIALKVALGEMADLLIKGQRVLPERALSQGFRFETPDLPTALANALA